MSKEITLAWLDDVDPKDYDAAYNYLSLKFSTHLTHAKNAVEALKEMPVVKRRANDILRATHLTPLPLTDPGVVHSLRKVLAGEKLSPVLVSGDDIADGYHRVSLAYQIDPFMMVPLRMA